MKTLRYIAALLLALLVAIASGCTTTRPDMQEVTVPAAPSTVQAPTASIVDTLHALPPVPPRGVRTAPSTRRTYTEAPDTPTVSIDRVRVAQEPDDVEIQYRVGDTVRVETWPLPAVGETLDIEADTDTSTRAQIRGTPQSYTTQAVVQLEEPSRWMRVWQSLHDSITHLITFAAGAFVGVLIGRILL